ncbi:TlpA disulfide reductase family protein [Mycobacterium sp. PSTR-4-N]|uniref:TlpA family protein disulfide reductase n=1 Tax=Mycobacterium sp. PSTR-4-N TaxID=2917745 RepID=UPI001F15391B|nr:TlpA disulfide reductase family protein [Mycobacterium sp. PSTR-4-N]MCG7593744.1 TlpA family protein disulfide reductase [Mycobacterium sp. PSTR-4-N]
MTDRRGRRVGTMIGGLVAVVALGAVLAAGLDRPAGTEGTSLPITQHPDRQAPPLAGTTLSGQEFRLEQYRGQIVVLNVMASWCSPCRDEVPLIAQAARDFAGQGVEFVGIAMRDEPESTRALLAAADAEHLTVVEDPDGVSSIDLGVRGVPETFVVDRSGMLRLHAFGPITVDWLDEWVAPMVQS